MAAERARILFFGLLAFFASAWADAQPVQQQALEAGERRAAEKLFPGALPSAWRQGNNPPVAFDDAYSTGFNEQLVVSAAEGVLSNDFDPDGNSIIAISFQSPSFGTMNLATDGSFTYTPDAGFSGSEVLTYTISDGSATAQAEITITVEANNPPVAFDDSYSTGLNEQLVVPAADGVLSNDFDPDGDSIIAISFQAPSSGTMNLATDGSFTYTPDAGFSGSEVLTYTISDGSATAQAEITIGVAAPIFQDRFQDN